MGITNTLEYQDLNDELIKYKIAVLECFIAVCKSNNYTPAENQTYLVLGDLLCMDSSPRAIQLLEQLKEKK